MCALSKAPDQPWQLSDRVCGNEAKKKLTNALHRYVRETACCVHTVTNLHTPYFVYIANETWNVNVCTKINLMIKFGSYQTVFVQRRSKGTLKTHFADTYAHVKHSLICTCSHIRECPHTFSISYETQKCEFVH